MAKRLFLLLFSALIGIINAPEILMASDEFDLSGLSNAGIVETVPVVKEPVVDTSVPEETAIESSAANVAESAGQEVYYAQVAVPQKVNYTVSFYINNKREYMNTAYNLSYDGLYKFKKMIYGHNSWNLLGNLANRYVGEVFTVTEGGAVRDYQVMATAWAGLGLSSVIIIRCGTGSAAEKAFLRPVPFCSVLTRFWVWLR